MRIVDRYIRNRVVAASLMVLLVLIGIESFMELVTQLWDIGKGHYGIWQVLMVVPLQTPTDVYHFFPIAGFLGSLIGLGRLATGSELIVMRASGVSIARIAWAVAKAALLFIIVMFVLGELLAPGMQLKAHEIKAQALGKQAGISSLHGIWLRNHRTFIYIQQFANNHEFKNLTGFRFDPNYHLYEEFHAPRGYLRKGHWVMPTWVATQLRGDHAQLIKRKQQVLGIALNPHMMRQSKQQVQEDSLWQIAKSIHYRREMGLITKMYEVSFWQRVLQPVTTLILMLLGVPFVFGSLRNASAGLRVVTGIIVGFAFYMLNRLFGYITIVYPVPALLAAVFPTVIFSISLLILLHRMTRRSVG